jgi:hypothetical protein
LYLAALAHGRLRAERMPLPNIGILLATCTALCAPLRQFMDNQESFSLLQTRLYEPGDFRELHYSPVDGLSYAVSPSALSRSKFAAMLIPRDAQKLFP